MSRLVERQLEHQPSVHALTVPVLSLFCGAGGLDAGFRSAGYKVVLGIDKSHSAICTHRTNFPESNAIQGDLVELGPEGIRDALLLFVKPGTHIGVIGGPPCQGFSRANTGSYTTDPRNSLVDLYVRAIKMLSKTYAIDFVVFENVTGIKDKKHRDTFERLVNGIRNVGLIVSCHECCAIDYGVPQLRRRVIVTGLSRGGESPLTLEKRLGVKSVGEAISHLAAPTFFRHGLQPAEIPVHQNHWTSRPRSKRFTTPLNEWKPTRSFKRTYWSKPSPTIAFGHREIHVHPSGKRRLSLYEAMLLQGFPADFVLEGNLTEQVEQVSNAVPPPLAESIALAIRNRLGVLRETQ